MKKNMRVLLINLKEPFKEKQIPCYVPPLGLWSIRAVAEQRTDMKIKVDICDMHIGEDLNHFLKKDYDMVGISVKFSIQHSEYIRIANLIRQCFPYAEIVSGGFHASAVEKPEAVSRVIKGDGEILFNREWDGCEMNALPIPTFSKKEIKKYWKLKAPHDLESKTNKWMTIETSRGCNRRCSFCGVPNFWGNWRSHTPAWVDYQLEYLVRKGIKEVFIEDDNVSLWKGRFIRIIESLNDYKLWWSTPNGIQVSTINNIDTLNALDNSTCWKLSLPFETGTEKARDLMALRGKWLSFDEANDLVKNIKNMGIKTVGFFVIGYPGENINDIKATLEYANSLPLDDRHIHIAIPYPGTPLYDLCKQKGYLTVDGEALYEELLCSNGLIKTDEFDPQIMEKIKKDDRDEAIKRKKALLYDGSTSI